MHDNTSPDNSLAKTVTIIVNGREKQYGEKRISFEQVVALAFGTYEDNENIVYTVTYSKGEDKKEGSMVKGDDVKVKDGMIFNVSRTDKS